MRSDLRQISTIENLFDLPESTDTINYNGNEISIRWLNGYHSQRSLYHSRYALLNNKILVINSAGAPHPYDVKKATSILEKIHVDLKLSNIDVIWDARDVLSPSFKVRKALNLCNNQLSEYWNLRYLIVPPRFRTLVQIYKFIFQRQSDKVLVADSVNEAINCILNQKKTNTSENSKNTIIGHDREKLNEMSKSELIDLIENDAREKAESTKKILEAIGQVTWRGKLNYIEVEAKENDPYYELLSAFSVLQQDVVEIIKEYKDLNKNLELKVAERIFDFIDKESNLRAILDNSDRVTWLMNTRFELIDFNLAFINEIKRRFKLTPKINQNVLELLDSDKEKEVWRARFETVLRGKPGIYLDQDNFNEIERVLETKMFPIKEIGKIKGVSVFIEDITEIKDSQFKLIEKNRDLEKVNSELDSFVYRVSHDLRAPLTSILGLISLMKIETNHEKVTEYISLQEKSINKLDLFIKEIINLSRNSRLGVTVSQIDFNNLLEEVFESQSFTDLDKEINKIISIEENLSFYTDRQRLSIILNNLISNALKYINAHESSPYVKIEIYSENTDCVIKVSDNGIGISEAYLPKIFEMFFRATQEFSGSGLGLYIVKESIQKLNGTITVKSKNGQGTTFKVVLPNLKDRFDAAPKLED